MKILEQLAKRADEHGIKFLVIGGHALNVHGYARQTGDLDLLVSKQNRDFWINLVKEFRYKPIHQHEVFARFAPSTLAEWPIDLMFVEDSIFQQILTDSVQGDFSTVQVPVPSSRHMIALKLHALKQRQPHREEKDILDVRKLLAISAMSDSDFRNLCEKYDRMDVFVSLRGNPK
ncbi:MAG: nucleotidyl transferase AbiEii/AbiGii toxin family protein [Deltaproteobacteria bacterium]|nr:nucleotidyl transferase AbiEii/AbiGii toxin family protein [Deltaproteobacteria bacterium]